MTNRIRLWTAIIAVTLYAAPVVYLRWSIREAHFAIASHHRPAEISVMDYGAKADGVTDDAAAFELALADATRHGAALEIPAAGNTIITASNIVDNQRGIQLSRGSNHGHGIFSAVNINHNKSVNIDAEKQLNGYTFNACHVYGDSPAQGVIRLTNSNGIHFSGGTIGATIVNDGGGMNVVFDNFSPGQAPLKIGGNNPNAAKTGLIFDDDRLLVDLSRLMGP